MVARVEVISSSRSQIFSVSSGKESSNGNNSNDNNSESSYVPANHNGIGENQSVNGEELSVAQFEDDIEKSVHLNQDGSMTVEMKVRFKIKEEETIKWTTTVSRAGLSGDKNVTICNSAMAAEDCLSNVNMSECTEPTDTPFLDTYNKGDGDSLKQFNEEVSGKESESDLKIDGYNILQKSKSADLDISNVPEDNIRPRFYRPPTPGPRRVRQKKAVVESVTLVSEKEVQKKTIGQFSYSEEIQNGENKSEYCMVAHSSRKKSSVNNPKFSEMSDNDILRLSSENIKEEMVFKVSHKSHDLTTNRKTLDVPDDNELVQNILEKSVVEQGAYNSLVSTCKANISGFIPSSKNYQAARPVSADHIHELCDIKQIKRSLSSYIRYSELSQSKNEERKCKASNLLTSQNSVHPVFPEHNEMEKMIASCSKAPEKINPTTAFSPVSESENQISVRAESLTASHLIDESQSASSLTKKKKRKLLSNFLEKGIYENQKDKEISGIIKSEEMLVTSKTTQVSTTQDNCSEMLQKKEMELLVKSNDRSDNSDKSICPEDDEFYPHNSVEQKGLSPNEKTRTKKRLAEVKSKSGKKNSSLLSVKSEDDLMTVDSKNETENSQDTQSTVKEGKHLTTNSIEQTPNLAMISKTLSEVPKVYKVEKGREDNILENLSLKKEKKQKKMKKNLSKGANKLNMSESSITVEALKQENFQEEIVEHSLENYVQTWLKNLSPNTVLPPIKKKEVNVDNSDVCHVSKENTDAFIDKEAKFITNAMHVTGKNHLFEHNQTKKTLKPLFELGTLEESSKYSRQNQTDSLICGNTTMVEESKYLLQSEFHHDSQLHVFHETHGNDKKASESDIQDTDLCHRKKSEVAVQVDCSIVSEKMGTDIQNNCMSSMLLRELQSTLLGLQKEHAGCIGKTYSLSDIFPPAFGSSSNLLLAWLLVLSLRESLIGTTKDDMQNATCSCSEVITQLQFLKHAAVMQKVDELKAAFSHFQETTEHNLLHAAKEFKKQDSTHCHENIPILENHNGIHLHEEEKSVEPCIEKNSVNSEEALTLLGEFESYSDIQKELCRATEIPDLSASKTQLDGQYADTNSVKCNLSSAIEPSETNEETAYNLNEKPHDKNINEESDTSVEPNSTVHSVTSNDKNCILDQDNSEIEGEKYIEDVTTHQREDEKVDPKSTGNDKRTNNQLKLVADTSADCNYEDCSVQEGKDDTETCEETSERLSTVSPLSFCYESKQITECDMSEGEQKLQVEELENKKCSDTSQLKKCLKSPATSDWSDYRPDTEESDYNFRASSDLTNESGEEAVLEKHYNTGYVKRTIERLYGKTEASFKPDFQKGFPYMSKALQKDAEEFSSAVVKKNIQLFQEPRPCFAEKFSHSSLSSQEFPEIINKDETTRRKEHTSSPTTPNGEETNYINDNSGERPKQHCQPSVHANEDEGILIDKGKWLLKENHLIRRSPPERTGMYGNLDTTSTDTVLDTNSDDAPYSHFGYLNHYPVLNEISSSELEDMAKPSKNFCNYFNMPHSSDSDPLQDDVSRESKLGLNGKITSLPVGNKEKIKPSVMVGSTSTHLSTEADTNFPAFTSVEFRLPDNKVHPLEQPLNDEPIRSQPTDVSNTNRNALQEDSLDKLHAICGQHCPILMVMVTPINEEQRGYAYQKASDIENQMGLCLLASKSERLQWLGKDLVKDENNYVTLKRNFINKIANNIFTRYYANNTIDFISNIGILTSSTLKDKSNLRRLHGIKNMNLKPMEVSNCQDNVSKHMPSDYMVDTKSKPPNTKPEICHILRMSPIHIVGEKLSPLLTDRTETCHSEIFLKCDTFINSIEHTASENMKNANAFSTEEEEGGGRRGEGKEGKEGEEGEEEREEGGKEGEGRGGGGGGEGEGGLGGGEVCFCAMDNGYSKDKKDM